MQRKISVDNVAKIIHISTISQCLIEDIEQSIYDDEFKDKVAKHGRKFVAILDKKLNKMIAVEDNEAQRQLLEYVNIVKSELDNYANESRKEIKRRLES